MALIKHKLAAATAVAAAFSLAATPAAAVELPRLAGQQVAKAGTLDAENRGHRGHRGHRDWDDDIDAGDVLAGILILGGIAAIASAAGKNREQSYPEPEAYPDDAGYQAPAAGGYNGGMAQAVDSCVAELEQSGERIATVDSASRDADGWRVSGELDGGAGYWCRIDNAGRISGVGGSGSAYAEPVADGQYDDDYYARARVAKAMAGAEADTDQVDTDQVDDGGYALAQTGE